MNSEIEKRVVDKMRVLSPEQQSKVLEFIDSLQPKERTPWQIWQEFLKDIPDEEWDNVPTDASINLDHYLYGAPKK